MKKIVLFFTAIFLFSFISASCSNSQININTAQLNELDNLYGIGSVKAQAIIDSRPFNSVEDLINVKGIGKITLDKIKSQGIACVENETGTNNQGETNYSNDKNSLNVKKESLTYSSDNGPNENSRDINLTPIMLNPKDIKSNINVSFNKKDYAKYGFVAFCVLLAVLFLLKSKKDKNEFGE